MSLLVSFFFLFTFLYWVFALTFFFFFFFGFWEKRGEEGGGGGNPIPQVKKKKVSCECTSDELKRGRFLLLDGLGVLPREREGEGGRGGVGNGGVFLSGGVGFLKKYIKEYENLFRKGKYSRVTFDDLVGR